MAPEKCVVDPSRDCLGAERVEELKQSFDTYKTQSTETHKEIFRRLNEVERGRAILDERYNTILDKLDALTAKVDALESKPAKRWESVVDKIIMVVVGALVGFVLVKLGIG